METNTEVYRKQEINPLNYDVQEFHTIILRDEKTQVGILIDKVDDILHIHSELQDSISHCEAIIGTFIEGEEVINILDPQYFFKRIEERKQKIKDERSMQFLKGLTPLRKAA